MKKIKEENIKPTFSETHPCKKVNTCDPTIEIFNKIINTLKTTNIPKYTQYRSDEKKTLEDFISKNLKGESESSTMIVFGQPGLGKTLVLKEVLCGFNKKNDLEPENIEKPKLGPKIESHYMNAMNYANCSGFIDDLASNLKCKKANSGIQYQLENIKKKIKASVKKTPIILLIDELETLSWHENDFSYVFDLLSFNVCGFIKICISNTLELFTPSQDKGVMYLSFRFLVFKPYETEELKGVLIERLRQVGDKALEFWPNKSIEYLVKKTITSKASDVRFTLSCAQEITESKLIKNNFHPVSISEVIEFFDKKFKINTKDLIHRVSYQAQVLLLAVFEKVVKTSDSVLLADLTKKFYEILEILGLDSSETVLDLLELLETYSFVKIEVKGLKNKSSPIIRNCLSKEELGVILSEVDIFKRFFQNVTAKQV